MNRATTLVVLFGLLALPVAAQEGAEIDGLAVRASYEPSWSDNDIARIANQLTGTWRTDDPISSMAGADGETEEVYLALTIAPVPVEGLSDTLYVESVRSNSAWEPYRRSIFQIYRYKDGFRLRTYELAVGQISDGVFDGMYAAPEYFPAVSEDDLIATIDIDLEPTPTGFSGRSPYPYPTGLGGAVEMTSSVSLDGDALTVSDRGYDAQGEIAWGADEDSSYVFVRSASLVNIGRRDDGMVIIDYGAASGPIAQNGDRMHVNYEGFLENMLRFDSSYERGIPFIFNYPPGSGAIVGWGLGVEDWAEGGRRKLVIPGYLGYGTRGNPRAGIPSDATLYFNIHLDQVEQAEPPAQPQTTPSTDASTEE